MKKQVFIMAFSTVTVAQAENFPTTASDQASYANFPTTVSDHAGYDSATQEDKTYQLDEVTISTVKEGSNLKNLPISVSLVGRQQLDAAHALSLKGVSSLVPNLFIPDYGSRLTSAVYIRGIGSRINSSSIGMYVDDMPMLDKSSFDFNFFDIERLDVLRGPQGTLYGNNSMGGIVRVHTRNPFDYQGTDIRLSAASGNAHNSASLIHYHRPSENLAFSAGFYTEKSEGFWENSTTGEDAEKLSSVGGRMRMIYRPTNRLSFDFSTNYDYSDEQAYPYFYLGSLTDKEEYDNLIDKISNNRESSYERRLFNAGLKVSYEADNFSLSSITSYQALRDRMMMDQDFIAADIYTLEQRQRQRTYNEEVIMRSKGNSRWQWINGLNLMYQHLHTSGPVTFYEDGIHWLENTINGSMPAISSIPMLQKMGFQPMTISFRDEKLNMGGRFKTPVFSAALYHQSDIRLFDHLTTTIGLRLDYQSLSMDYDAPADVNFAFTMLNPNPMMSLNLQDLSSHLTLYKGSMDDEYLRLLPKIGLRYEWNKGNQIYVSASQGQRSGGYNLQMFSDLLQDALKNDMMRGTQEGIGNYLGSLPMPPTVAESVKKTIADNMPIGEDPTTEQVRFKPEYAWCYELGSHLQTEDHRLNLDVALFLNGIRDQQIARFAEKGFGRQMVNAGRSESYGIEMQAICRPVDALTITANYGFTHATFTDYNDGKRENASSTSNQDSNGGDAPSADNQGGKGGDYSGNYVPFVPQNTLTLDAAYTFSFPTLSWLNNLTIGATYNGVGKIYWTESNMREVTKVSQTTDNNKENFAIKTIDASCQEYYSQIGARCSLLFPYDIRLDIWAKNLTDTEYNTMYFESASRAFCQKGKPRQIGIDLRIHF